MSCPFLYLNHLKSDLRVIRLDVGKRVYESCASLAFPSANFEMDKMTFIFWLDFILQLGTLLNKNKSGTLDNRLFLLVRRNEKQVGNIGS